MCVLAGVAATSAAADVRTGTVTVDPNQPGATFGSPPAAPLITASVSEDEQSGTITFSENSSAAFGLEISSISVRALVSDTSNPVLTSSGANGTLPAKQVTNSGGTQTIVWSDPVLANQDFVFVTLEDLSYPTYNGFYFAGYAPTVAVANPGPQSTRAGTFVTVPVTAKLNGLASADDDVSSFRPPTVTATGLPPGVTLDQTDGYLSGMPTRAGVYAVTATASFPVNSDTQAVTGTTQFQWTVLATTPSRKPKPKYSLNNHNVKNWALAAVIDEFYGGRVRRSTPKDLHLNHCVALQSGRFRCDVSWLSALYGFGGRVTVGNVNPRTGRFRFGFTLVRTTTLTGARKRISVSY
jgi:hypothetical protein